MREDRMARTRLRGLEIGDIQFGIEVPESCAWEWPNGPVAEYACLPRDPEVHVGVRVAALPSTDLGGEVYGFGACSFEVARRGGDWLLGLSRRGVREHLATFDREFRNGEVLVSEEVAGQRRFPLRAPLDEWVVVHRTIARGGLCLNATAHAIDGQASIRLGANVARVAAPNRWMVPRTGLFGRDTLLLGRRGSVLRSFGTPWSQASDPMLGVSSRVAELMTVEESPAPFRELLDPTEAAELLVAHAVVPLSDEEVLEKVLRNAQRLVEDTRIVRYGENMREEGVIAWQSFPLQNGLAPPDSNF
jgi:hypothetical protein